MNAQELFFPASLFAMPNLDVERAKLLYLSTYVHRGCGGSPVAYLFDGSIGCSCCFTTWPGEGPLGKALRRTGAFNNLLEGGQA
jgi:hypothetical protein